MKTCKWIEFFEGDEGRLSMTRLLCLMSFFPASYVMIRMQTEAALGWYLSAYVLGYLGGKASDMLGKPRPRPVHVDNVEEVNVNQPKKRGKHVDADID